MAFPETIKTDEDILNAFNIAEQIEGCAEAYVKARMIGRPVILD